MRLSGFQFNMTGVLIKIGHFNTDTYKGRLCEDTEKAVIYKSRKGT